MLYNRNQRAKAVTWNWQFLQEKYTDREKCYKLTDRQVVALLTTLVQMGWATRWHDPPTDFELVQDFSGDLGARLLTPIPCGSGTQHTYVTGEYPDCIKVSQCGSHTVIDIYENEDCMAIINVYENSSGNSGGCGCGCGGNGGGNGLPTGSGTPPLNTPGATGGYNDSIPTLCDAITVLPAVILDMMDDFVGQLMNGTFVLSLFSADLIPILNSIEDQLQTIEAQLEDPDFIVKVENAMVSTWNDPWTPLQRQDLINFAYRMPVLFEGANMWAMSVLWANVANLNTINKAVRDAAGTGDYSGLCAAVSLRTGRELGSIPDDTEEVIVIENNAGIDGLSVALIEYPAGIGGGVVEYDIFNFAESKTLIGGGYQFTSVDLNGGTGQGLLMPNGQYLIFFSHVFTAGVQQLDGLGQVLPVATKNEIAAAVNNGLGWTPTLASGGTTKLIGAGEDMRIHIDAAGEGELISIFLIFKDNV